MKFFTITIALGISIACGSVLGAAADLNLTVIDKIKVGGPGGWDYVMLDPGRHVLYLTHGSAVSSVDLTTRTANPHLADAQGAHVALPVHGGESILITHGKANQVTVNDAHTGAVQATIATDPGPDAAIEEPASGRIFVMANHSDMVDVLDLQSNSVISRIQMNGAPEAAAIDGQGLVFTHLEDKNAIVVLDGKRMNVKARYEIKDCEEPSGIAYVQARRWIVSACKNGIARFTDVDSGAEVATVAIGKHPDFAAVDNTRHLAFIPCGDGTLSVVQLDQPKPKLLGVVATEDGARTAALDEKTGRIYLPAADFGTAAVPGERRPVLADTFRVIVVGSR